MAKKYGCRRSSHTFKVNHKKLNTLRGSLTNDEKSALEEAKKLKIIPRGNGKLYCIDSMCFVQARLNQSYYRQLGKDLEIVSGVVGVKERNGSWSDLYGDYYKKEEATYKPQRFHVWMEDKTGGIYDIIQPIMVAGTDSKLHSFDVLEGIKRNELKRQGIHYISIKNYLPKTKWEDMMNSSFVGILHDLVKKDMTIEEAHQRQKIREMGFDPDSDVTFYM